MRNLLTKLPIILPLAALLLTAGWSQADARRYQLATVVADPQAQLPRGTVFVAGEPDQPGVSNPAPGGNGVRALSRSGGSDMSPAARAGMIWKVLFLRLFAR